MGHGLHFHGPLTMTTDQTALLSVSLTAAAAAVVVAAAVVAVVAAAAVATAAVAASAVDSGANGEELIVDAMLAVD